MNNKEAAEVIVAMRKHEIDILKINALELAIKALEQEPDSIHNEREQAYMKGYEDASKRYRTEPCDDVISRQAAIRLAEQGQVQGFEWQFKKLVDLPSVSMEKIGWTPVSEGLPSDDEYVIVSVLDDHGDTPWKYTTVAWLCNGVWISDNDILCGTAVAWMPLPQPCKAVGEVGESE